MIFGDPLYAIVTPTIAIIIIAMLSFVGKIRRMNKLLGSITTIAIGITLVQVIGVFINLKEGPIVRWFTVESPNASCFIIDYFSAIMAMLFAFIGLMVALYSITYMEEGHSLHAYYILLLIMLIGLLGTVYAGDFFTFFVFYEALSVSAISLVAYFKNEEAIEAALKYLIMDATGSTMVLLSFSLVYAMTGTLNIAVATRIFNQTPMSLAKILTLTLMICGFGFKAAIFPMHSWLIDAHPAAPSGISAMLSGVVIKAGVYAIMRALLFLAPWRLTLFDVLLIIAVITVTIPNIIALMQEDVKRTLAYSSIYNVGIIIAGLSTGSALGIVAAIFHLINHALLKALMFMGAGAFIQVTESRKFDDLCGIGRKMKITGTIFSAGALALASLPPFPTFFSKFLIIWAAIQLGGLRGIIIAALILINSIISIGYYGKMIKTSMMMAPDNPNEKLKELNMMTVALVILFIIVILIGIWPNLVLEQVQKATEALLSKEQFYQVIP